MNLLGSWSPSRPWRQRASASTPTISPVSIRACGWNRISICALFDRVMQVDRHRIERRGTAGTDDAHHAAVARLGRSQRLFGAVEEPGGLVARRAFGHRPAA
ncbi:hypothetical protein LXJ56_29600, partial [Escherichia coli]|nr:hypothetical protein [Escherichia coli]